ncbi:MAG: amidohydrolase family protein [Lachnospiraceae bacterium]|nr:amidohydrolase family protein [Lachnospiraceae bacterium]
MIIDSHEHVMLPAALQIKKMDEAGVDQAILFTTTPHVERSKSSTLDEIGREMQALYQLLSGSYTPQERMDNMRGNIVDLKQAISAAPERFLGFGPVPLGLPDAETETWIDTQITRNSFRGIGEFTPGSDVQMEQLETIFRAVLGSQIMPIWVHTFHPVTANGIRILMNLCRKYPSIPVIFGHMGGANWMDVIAFAKKQKNSYLDLSAVFIPLSVRTALTELPEKCLFSSDAPFGEPKLSRELIEFVSPSAEITEMALGGNIARLLEL